MSLIVKPEWTAQAAEPISEAAATPQRPERRGGGPSRLAPRILVGLLAVWLLSGVYLIPADQQAVVTRFGAVVEDRVMPGMHYDWPYPIGGVYKLRVRQLQRGVIGGESADGVLGRLEPLRSQFLTGDQNIINVRTVVQYSVASPRDYLFRVRDAGRAIAVAVEAELGRQIASRSVDEVLTTEKVAIQETVRQRAQRLLDSYGLGVALSTVNIEQVSAPPEAAEAFRDVASARADAARIVNEAQGYANDILPRARGEAQQLLEVAEAYKQRKVQQAFGDAARFTRLAQEYVRNPEVTRSRLYLETMEQILPRLRKTIVDDQGSLDLTIIRRDQPREGAAGAAENNP